MRPTQEQMYRKAERAIFDANSQFMDMVKDGMTADELGRLIRRRPTTWARFSNWLDKLPKEKKLA